MSSIEVIIRPCPDHDTALANLFYLKELTPVPPFTNMV